MNNYYLLGLDSLVQTFSVLDSGQVITFKYSSQDTQTPFEELQAGDKILGYYYFPVNRVKILFEVFSVDSQEQIELIKRLEIDPGIEIDKEITGLVEQQNLVRLEKIEFEKIYREMQEILNRESEDEYSYLYALDNIKVSAEIVPVPHNFLVFGAPGTGKSHEITKLQKEYFSDKESWERVTFYSTYSYSNFVGCYKPKMRGNDIVYGYVAGPFVRILEKAFKNPDKNYLLIIEEINRANPAAVFGDVFQLLDRDNGKSEYYINTSEELKLYLAQKFVKGFDDISDEDEKEKLLDAFSQLYIPSNMYIWATMNSADQGVYPMDTAFKRRWEFRYIGINENQEKMKDVYFYAPHKEKGKVKVSWNKLRCEINDILSGPQCRVNEDKLLGPYFISGELLKVNESNKCVLDNEKFIQTFKSKVIMYLFEDAAKQRQTEVFKGCSDSRRFSSICDKFDQEGLEIFGEGFTLNLIEE